MQTETACLVAQLYPQVGRIIFLHFSVKRLQQFIARMFDVCPESFHTGVLLITNRPDMCASGQGV